MFTYPLISSAFINSLEMNSFNTQITFPSSHYIIASNIHKNLIFFTYQFIILLQITLPLIIIFKVILIPMIIKFLKKINKWCMCPIKSNQHIYQPDDQIQSKLFILYWWGLFIIKLRKDEYFKFWNVIVKDEAVVGKETREIYVELLFGCVLLLLGACRVFWFWTVLSP